MIIGCSVSNNSKKPQSLRLVVDFPLTYNDEPILRYMRDTIPVYYYLGYTIYQVPSFKVFLRNDIQEREEKKYKNFLFHEKSSVGYYFDTINNNPIIKQISVDSFLIKRAYKTDYKKMYDKIVETNVSNHGNIKIREYKLKIEPEDNDLKSIDMYYCEKYNHFRFSFSDFLDNFFNEKLYQIRISISSSYYPEYKRTLPEREFRYEIQETHEDQKKIEELFKSLIEKLQM